MVLRRTDQPGLRKAVRVSHRFTAGSARFDEDNLVPHAGLVPLLELAERTRLPQLLADKVSIRTARIKSGAANPVPKLLRSGCRTARSSRTVVTVRCTPRRTP
jgi:hypothetical protein